ncbi:TraC family protein, partial [Rhizobium jaguaris]
MKKPSSKIRDEIARLQEQLKLAETREAERIGRIALKAGLGEIEIDEGELQAAFEDLAKRFRGGKVRSTGGKGA